MKDLDIDSKCKRRNYGYLVEMIIQKDGKSNN